MPESEPSADDPPRGERAVPWEQRVARGEINRRRVNEAIEQGRVDDEAQVFVCECGRLGCTTTLALTLAAYEGVRTGFERFLVAPGHEVDGVDVVVERHAGHLVVAKLGTGREMARDADPRPEQGDPD
jgi:predicted ThiF/HesA family dinucleotide-utilizing enzyme